MSVQVFGPEFAARLHKDLKSLMSFNEKDYRLSAVAQLREKMVQPFRFTGVGSHAWTISRASDKGRKLADELREALGESYQMPLITMAHCAPWLLVQAFHDINQRAYCIRYPDSQYDGYTLPYNHRDDEKPEPLTFEVMMRIAQRLSYIRYQVQGEMDGDSSEQWIVELTALAYESALRFHESYESLKWGE